MALRPVLDLPKPAADGLISKSNIFVGITTVQQTLGMSTMALDPTLNRNCTQEDVCLLFGVVGFAQVLEGLKSSL